jgi:hypothetical protein
MVKSVLSTARDRRLDLRMRGDGSGYIRIVRFESCRAHCFARMMGIRNRTPVIAAGLGAKETAHRRGSPPRTAGGGPRWSSRRAQHLDGRVGGGAGAEDAADAQLAEPLESDVRAALAIALVLAAVAAVLLLVLRVAPGLLRRRVAEVER